MQTPTRVERWAKHEATEKDPQVRLLKLLEQMEGRQDARWNRLYRQLTWLPITWSVMTLAFGFVGWFVYSIVVALAERP